MNAKEVIARRVRRQVTLHDEYLHDINTLIDKYEAHALEGLIPRAYIDALENCHDVARGPAAA